MIHRMPLDEVADEVGANSAASDSIRTEPTHPFPGGSVHPGWPPGFWERFYQLSPLPDDFEQHIAEFRAHADADAARRAALLDAEVAIGNVPGDARPQNASGEQAHGVVDRERP